MPRSRTTTTGREDIPRHTLEDRPEEEDFLKIQGDDGITSVSTDNPIPTVRSEPEVVSTNDIRCALEDILTELKKHTKSFNDLTDGETL